MRQPWEMILSHLLMELTSLLAGRTMRTSGHDAFWLVFCSNTSTHCEWPTLIAMPPTSAAPAGYCPELTPPQLPSGKSQMFPLRLPNHSPCSHLFGYHPPVVQAVSLQLAVLPDCHMVSQPSSFHVVLAREFLWSMLFGLTPSKVFHIITSLLALVSAQSVMR